MGNESWNEMYKCAQQYYESKGDLLVPAQYTTEHNIKLGNWISSQRGYYKNNKLSKERINLLEQIGMVWSVFDAQWFEFYKMASNYYNENGNLLVPLKYTTSTGARLGYWIGTQRRQYKEGKISKDKIDLLNRISMVWSQYELQWYEFYDLAVEYYKTNGNLLIPLRYKINNIRLGNWISYQRIKHSSGKLSEEKKELLEKIGMAWDVISATWDKMYEIARLYYKENGNLSISNTAFTYKGASLGSWILTQRKNYFENILSDKQISMLNEIGMEWVYTNNPDYVWEKNYNTVLEFYSKYKHLYIPISYVTKDEVRIGVWLYDRKLEYERNELSEDKRKKLDKLDKTWLEPVNTKSSFPEQAVLFYVKKAFPSATKFRTREISEIDIYIPEIKVGIEYDGPSHKSRVEADKKKAEKCRNMGIELIRIRDKSLPILNDESYKIILEEDSFSALNKGIEEVLKHLSTENCINVNVKRDYIEIADNHIKSIDLDWYLKYEKLKEYYKEHGNINVPIYYKSKRQTWDV